MQACTGHDTDVHKTFLYMFSRNFFVPPVTSLELRLNRVHKCLQVTV